MGETPTEGTKEYFIYNRGIVVTFPEWETDFCYLQNVRQPLWPTQSPTQWESKPLHRG
jgi:hypothetical protein